MTTDSTKQGEALLNEILKYDTIVLECVPSDGKPYEPGRYQTYAGLFGDLSVVDTHSWGYKVYKFVTNCVKFCFGMLLILFAILLLTALFL